MPTSCSMYASFCASTYSSSRSTELSGTSRSSQTSGNIGISSNLCKAGRYRRHRCAGRANMRDTKISIYWTREAESSSISYCCFHKRASSVSLGNGRKTCSETFLSFCEVDRFCSASFCCIASGNSPTISSDPHFGIMRSGASTTHDVS